MGFHHVVLCALSSVTLSATSFANPQKLVTANQDFGQQLVERVVRFEHGKDKDKNVFVSPLSASLALSMLANGANGPTLNGILNTLSANGLSVADLNTANQQILTQLTQTALRNVQEGDFTLTIANSIWSDPKSDFSYQPNYVQTMSNVYKSEVKSIAFKKTGAVEVNKWASEKTNGKIKSIIDQATMDDDLFFILMNATYFKAGWAAPFPENLTKTDGEFTLVSGAKAKLAMMQQGKDLLYSETDDAQIVEMPYVGHKVSMVIMLPKPGKKIDSLLSGSQSLAGGSTLNRFRANAQEHNVTLVMPKFGFDYSVKLNDILKSLGMDAAFTDNADFSSIGRPASKVSLVKQNTFVKVDEKGTEAAAVTLIGGARSASIRLPKPAVTMTVDHPFYFAIVQRDTMLPIFAGVVMKPESK